MDRHPQAGFPVVLGKVMTHDEAKYFHEFWDFVGLREAPGQMATLHTILQELVFVATSENATEILQAITLLIKPHAVSTEQAKERAAAQATPQTAWVQTTQRRRRSRRIIQERNQEKE